MFTEMNPPSISYYVRKEFQITLRKSWASPNSGFQEQFSILLRVSALEFSTKFPYYLYYVLPQSKGISLGGLSFHYAILKLCSKQIYYHSKDTSPTHPATFPFMYFKNN